MSKWKAVRVMRVWMSIAASGARLAYYLDAMGWKWGD
jgi:hypothetical protein